MQITSYGKNILILNLIYPLKSRNVPLGVHVPQFGNPCLTTISKIGIEFARRLTSKKRKGATIRGPGKFFRGPGKILKKGTFLFEKI